MQVSLGKSLLPDLMSIVRGYVVRPAQRLVVDSAAVSPDGKELRTVPTDMSFVTGRGCHTFETGSCRWRTTCLSPNNGRFDVGMGRYFGIVHSTEHTKKNGDYNDRMAYIKCRFAGDEISILTFNRFKDGHSGESWTLLTPNRSDMTMIDWMVDLQNKTVHITVDGHACPWPIFSGMSCLHECVPYVGLHTHILGKEGATIRIESEDE